MDAYVSSKEQVYQSAALPYPNEMGQSENSLLERGHNDGGNVGWEQR
jgi:hypothetical protein